MGGMHKRRTPTQRQNPPLLHDARTQDLHDSIHICCCRPGGSGLGLCLASMVCFLGTTVQLARCELALQSSHLQLRTRCSTTVYGLDHGGGGKLSSWRRKRLVAPPSLFFHLFLSSCDFVRVLAQGGEYSKEVTWEQEYPPPPPALFSLCNAEHGLISRRARHHRRSVARPPSHDGAAAAATYFVGGGGWVGVTCLPRPSCPPPFHPFHRHHHPLFSAGDTVESTKFARWWSPDITAVQQGCHEAGGGAGSGRAASGDLVDAAGERRRRASGGM